MNRLESMVQSFPLWFRKRGIPEVIILRFNPFQKRSKKHLRQSHWCHQRKLTEIWLLWGWDPNPKLLDLFFWDLFNAWIHRLEERPGLKFHKVCQQPPSAFFPSAISATKHQRILVHMQCFPSCRHGSSWSECLSPLELKLHQERCPGKSHLRQILCKPKSQPRKVNRLK